MIEIDPAFSQCDVTVALTWITADVVVHPSDETLLALIDAETSRADEDPSAAAMIAASRQAYKKLGKDPSRYRPAAEALRRRVRQGKGLFRINNIIEINNLVSLQTGCSIGAYDQDKIEAPLTLIRAGAGDSYHGIGRGPLNLENLPVLRDATGPFGSPTSDSERSMITHETRHILMVFYGLDAEKIDPEPACHLLVQHAEATNLQSGSL